MPAEKDLDPTGCLWAFLGFELRRLRKDSGLTQEALAGQVHSTGGFVGQIETAERRPKLKFVEALDRALGSGDHLQLLAHHALQSSLSQPLWFSGYVNAEQHASRIRTFEPQVIPGLLQAEEYADELFRQIRMSPDEAEANRARRLARQAVLHRKRDPLRLWVILDESALLRTVKSPRVSKPQLEFLLRLCELPNVVIEVLPLSCGLHACMDGSLVLLSVPGHPECAYVEGMGYGRIIAESEAVSEVERRYDLLRCEALSPTRSAQLVHEYLESA